MSYRLQFCPQPNGRTAWLTRWEFDAPFEECAIRAAREFGEAHQVGCAPYRARLLATHGSVRNAVVWAIDDPRHVATSIAHMERRIQRRKEQPR